MVRSSRVPSDEVASSKSKVGRADKAAKTTTRVNSFDAEMAALASKQANAESKSAGGTFISTKGGNFSIGGNMVKGGKIRAVVIDSIFCNTFYEDAYNPDQQASPACYAYGETEEDMAPHDDCDNPQHNTCAGCPLNAFGSAAVGKGKACKNQRRLALVLEDDLTDGAAQMLMLNVSVTSCRAWATYVQQVTSAQKLPTCGVLTEISIFTAPGKTYAQMSFAHERDLEQGELAVILPRRDEASNILNMPFPKRTEEEAPKKKAVPSKKAPVPVARKFKR